MSSINHQRRSRRSRTQQEQKLQTAASLLSAGVLKIGEAATLVGLTEETVARHLYRSGKPRRQPGKNAAPMRRQSKIEELERLLGERRLSPAEIRKLLKITRAEYYRSLATIQQRWRQYLD